MGASVTNVYDMVVFGTQKLWLLYGKSFTMPTEEFNIQFKCVPNREAVVETAKYHITIQDLRFQHHPT